MGNYGYNPDEHYETKLTLIDKDGFQKEGNTEDIISDYNELREEIENRGIPSGGESGQMLTKASNDDYDVEWSDIPSFTENVETTVANATNTWLQTNITNPSNPPLDSSLSLSNAAAPADKVGELKSAINDIEDILEISENIEIDPGELFNGIYNTSAGKKTTDFPYGLANENKIDIAGKTVRVSCEGAYVRCFRYPADTIVGFDYTQYTENAVTISATDTLTRLTFVVRLDPNDSTALTQEQITTLTNKIKVVQIVEKTSVRLDEIESSIEEIDGNVDALGDEVDGLKTDLTAYKTFVADDMVNTIRSTTTGDISTSSYPYAYSNKNPIKFSNGDKVTINCQGYYIRAFLLPETGTTGFTYTNYTQNSIEVTCTSALVCVAFCVRKDPSSSTALTDAEMLDILEKLNIPISAIDKLQEEIDNFNPSGLDSQIDGRIITTSENSSFIGSPVLYLSDVPTDSGIASLSDLYARYDALCTSYPHWIQRQTDLGNDSDGNAIRHYIVRMFDPIVGTAEAYTYETETKVNHWADTFSYRRAFISAGVHGDEKSSVWALIYFLEELIPSTADWARFIKGNFMLDIVPVICPYGYIHDTRNNKNDVNVNRDYLTDSASMQPETVALTTYFQSIKDDLFCALDLHTTAGKYGYISAKSGNPAFSTIMRLANQIFGVCVNSWESLANELGSDSTYYPYCYGCISNNTGTMHHYMYSEGITNYACTVEGVHYYNTTSLVKVTKIIKDEFVNLLMGFLALQK